MSKGSSPRPYSVSQQEYANNYNKIFRKPDRRMIEDQLAEDEAFEKIARETEVKDSLQGG